MTGVNVEGHKVKHKRLLGGLTLKSVLRFSERRKQRPSDINFLRGMHNYVVT